MKKGWIMNRGWHRTSVAFVVLVLVGAASVPPAVAQPGPGDYARSMVFDGRTRTYDVHVPPGYVEGSAVPLVLDFHGYTGNSSSQAATIGGSIKPERRS